MIATTNANEIPAAIPTVESEEADEREKLLQAAAEENNRLSLEADEEVDDGADDPVSAKPKKSKLISMFAVFLILFVLMVAGLCWFFGLSVFAAAPTQNVERNAKRSEASETLNDDQKLKNALDLVADKNATASVTPFVEAHPNESEQSLNLPDSSVSVPPIKAADSITSETSAPIAVPDSSVNQNVGGSSRTNQNPVQTNSNSGENNSALSMQPNAPVNALFRTAETEANSGKSPVGRSLFFGKQNQPQITQAAQATAISASASSGDRANISGDNQPLPFGTLLPVRFLGALYTLRASGGVVRLQLTRAVRGKNFSYPSGTILVGTLRGSEYKRAFVTVFGLIDPASDGLIKFEGELMGTDGASGVGGRRRTVKSGWTRVFGGLREAGGAALGAIGNIRSGGTVVISDSGGRAANLLSGELSGLVRGKESNEFVEVAAGTNAYVLVTDLPGEVEGVDRLSKNALSSGTNLNETASRTTGLSETELVELLTEGSPEKIRRALPRMSNEFKSIAEQALAAMQNK